MNPGLILICFKAATKLCAGYISNETLHYGEDNWRYVNDDYKLKPVNQHLMVNLLMKIFLMVCMKQMQPYWKDYEIRRYAYWSVFAGGCGFTYGHNSVMQFYTPGDSGISFFPKIKWQEGLNAPGAGQMQYLKKLMLSKVILTGYLTGIIVDNGERYDKIIATKGKAMQCFMCIMEENLKLKLRN